MGNECDRQEPDLQLPTLSQTNFRFIRQSLQLLRVNGKLSSISIHQQKLIESKLQALRHKNKREGSLALSDNRLVACYKNSLFFLGTMRDNKFDGDHCHAVFAGGKIYSGSFRLGKAKGSGSVQFLAEGCNGTNLVMFTGDWNDKIWGSLELNRSGHKRFILIDREKVRKKNVKFIEYSNYDTYFGQTQKDLAHGFGKYVYRKGDLSKEYPYYEGNFEKGVRSGEGEWHYSAVCVLKINWKNGKPEGDGVVKMSSNVQPVLFQSGTRLLTRPSLVDADADYSVSKANV